MSSSAAGTVPKSVVLFCYSEGALTKPMHIRMHHHEFWQLQWVSGPWTLLTPTAERRLKPSQLVIIPPGMRHGFRHPGQGEVPTAVMFNLFGFRRPDAPLVLGPCGFTRSWMKCVTELRRRTADSALNDAIGAMLDALLFGVFDSDTEDKTEVTFTDRVRSYVDTHTSRAVTVNEIASELGVSRGYLSAVFREECGQTVKQFIDARRLEMSRRLLRYGDLSISQIAETMQFPDIFTFSKFFKSRSGESPRQFRRRVRAEDAHITSVNKSMSIFVNGDTLS